MSHRTYWITWIRDPESTNKRVRHYQIRYSYVIPKSFAIFAFSFLLVSYQRHGMYSKLMNLTTV